MPSYDFECPDGHIFELRSSITNKPDAPPCTHIVHEQEVSLIGETRPRVVPTYCGKPSKQIFTTMPVIWIPGVNKETVLDYPGSKRLKAGYVHHMVDPGVKKVSSGYGGVLNPSFKDRHPLSKVVQPDWKAPKEQ